MLVIASPVFLGLNFLVGCSPGEAKLVVLGTCYLQCPTAYTKYELRVPVLRTLPKLCFDPFLAKELDAPH